MSSKRDEQANHVELQNIASQLGVALIETESVFQTLIKRLNDEVDWFFKFTEADYEKLENALKQYFRF